MILLINASSFCAAAEVLFTEAWPNATIDGSKWTVNAPTANQIVRLEAVGAGDYALVMANQSFDWTNYILSKQAFPRGNNLRVTFKVWGDNTRIAAGQAFPGVAGICGPWHGSTNPPIYATVDEGIGYVWSALTFNENNAVNTGPALSGSFHDAFAAANSKGSSIRIRFWAGDTIGGKLEWSATNGATWITEYDTRNISGGSAANLYLGFCSLASYVFIDDIVVETGVQTEPTPAPLPDDIRDLTEHFNAPGAEIEDWTFIPAANVGLVNTANNPGLAVIRTGELSQDVKAVLNHPIPINKYPLPWEFQLGLAQNFSMLAGAYSGQANHAEGLNIAVTFSDPSTWPADRSVQPPNTRSFQLLNVHLGGIPNALPQLVNNTNIFRTRPVDNVGEAYLIYGRGNLGSGDAFGHWNIPQVWVGDGSRYAGPASSQIYYRVVVLDSTRLSIGIKFDVNAGWHERQINVSQFGQIRGIWEIGPIISCDRWIPDTLCPALGISNVPSVDPPTNIFETLLDYCHFQRSRPIPFEQLSDDFNIPGFFGKWVTQPQSVIQDTYSNPGYLTWTLLGPSIGTGIAPVGGDLFSLTIYPPPWEMEVCFIPPPDTMPWNFYMNFAMQTNQARGISWYPSVRYNPQLQRHELMDASFKVNFNPPVPASILSSKPLYMLVQWIDQTHVRQAFKAHAEDPWHFSEIFDIGSIMNPGEQISGNFIQADWSTVSGSFGGYYGIPQYTQYKIDYIHYRTSLSEERTSTGNDGYYQ